MNRRFLAAAIAVLVIAALAWKVGDRDPALAGASVATPATPVKSPEDRRADATPVFALSPVTTAPSAGVIAAGRVLAGGAAFEGARVTAVLVDRPGAASEAQAISAKDGRFELAGLPLPPFRLRAEAPGWRPGWAEVGSLGKETRLEGFVLALRAAGTVRGRVTAAGNPVADATIFAGDESSNDLGGSVEAQAQSGIDGEFTLDPVRPGPMTLVAFHAGTGFATAVVDVREGRVADAALALAPLGRVKGRVLAMDGSPIAGVRVVAVDPGALDLVPAMDGASIRLLTVATRMQETATDAEGRFGFQTLVSRTPSLAIRMPGFKPAARPLELSASGEAADVEVRLKPE